jgi:pyruvate formate lyase activating enzyme
LKVNFGGFVPISTVDWRGRAVCTVFLRGCPARCFYCHNPAIQSGEDLRDAADILVMIRESRLLTSGVVFSGGEPTQQKEALIHLARACREMGLHIGLHTNGVFPETLQMLIDLHLVDMIALDVKTTWDRYDDLLGMSAVERVRHSLALCILAQKNGLLEACEAVVTLFRGNEDDVVSISLEVGELDLVLQQGVASGYEPLTLSELEAVASQLGRRVRIRTREDGEVVFDPRMR